MTDNKYALRYTLKPETRKENYTPSDVDQDAYQGLCDAMIFISILKPADGSYSQMLLTFDGETAGPMEHDDVFKAWLMTGLLLHDQKNLSGWKKQMVGMVANMARKIFKRN